MFQWQSKVSS